MYVTSTFGFLKNFRLIRRGNRHQHRQHESHHHYNHEIKEPQQPDEFKGTVAVPLEQTNVTNDGEIAKVEAAQSEQSGDGFTNGTVVKGEPPKKQRKLFQRSRTRGTRYHTSGRTHYHHGQFHSHRSFW